MMEAVADGDLMIMTNKKGISCEREGIMANDIVINSRGS